MHDVKRMKWCQGETSLGLNRLSMPESLSRIMVGRLQNTVNVRNPNVRISVNAESRTIDRSVLYRSDLGSFGSKLYRSDFGNSRLDRFIYKSFLYDPLYI